MSRLCLKAAFVLAVAASFAAWSAPSATATATATAATPPPLRWVAVSVATLWVEPDTARKIDAPALAAPADPRAWVAGMTVAQKRWLVGRLETQALYGTRVYLLKTSGSWSKVAVAGQPTPRNTWGYPGWLPTAQLTDVAPAVSLGSAPRMAIVRRRTAWLWQASDLSGRMLELSYGTRLPAVAWTSTSVETATLDGTHVFMRRSAVALRDPATPWPKLKGATLVAQAKRFLGLPYLWAGASGYGLDCSGFTHTVYRALGKSIPRDAGPQFAKGKKIGSRSSLRLGDLVFFRSSSGGIHHVGMYVGDGKMIHAPATGKAAQVTSLYIEPYFSEFAGGRRYTP
jgi:cell wall-associated NlpC family hydrolase